jgi:hypothetical protein
MRLDASDLMELKRLRNEFADKQGERLSVFDERQE